MAHSVSEAAARAVKNSQRAVTETRSPEQILKDIRSNLNQKLFVTPNDQRFLLEQYDLMSHSVGLLRERIAELESRAAAENF